MHEEQAPLRGEIRGLGSGTGDQRVQAQRPGPPVVFARVRRQLRAVVVSRRRHRFLGRGVGGVPMTWGRGPAPETPACAAGLNQVANALGAANLAAGLPLLPDVRGHSSKRFWERSLQRPR
jgi:hypothetical protein